MPTFGAMQKVIWIAVLLTAFSCLLSPLAAQTLVSDYLNLQDTTQQHVLYTRRGDVLIGRVISIVDTQLDFQLRNQTGVLSFALREISFVGLAGEDPLLSVQERYQPSTGDLTAGRAQNLVYSATAFGYKQQRGEYRNTVVLYNYVDFGIGENFTLGGGALVPAAINFRIKGNVSLGETVHLGVAANNFQFLFDSYTWSHFYAIATIGTPSLFLNVTYGAGIDWGFDERDELISLGFSATLSERWRVASEVFFISGVFTREVLPSIVLDRFGKRSKLQFGLAVIPGSDIPFFPIAAYSAYF